MTPIAALWLAIGAHAGPVEAAPAAEPSASPAEPAVADDAAEADAARAEAEAEAAKHVRLKVMLQGTPKGGGGTLIVQAEYDPAGAIGLPEPEVDRLTFTPEGPPQQEPIGDRVVVTQRYVFAGPKGSYEVPPLTARWTPKDGPAFEVQSTPVFVDIDVPPPRDEEPSDIVEPGEIVRWPWVAIAVVGGLFAVGLAYAFRPRRASVAPVAPPVPPDVAAIRAWEAVRDDRALTIDDKAREVARIFRVYVEAVLGFEATSRTTHELLEYLGALIHLPEGNVPRAKRVLRAADRIKFAEHRPDGDWLVELDADLRAFVDSTRPSVGRPANARQGSR